MNKIRKASVLYIVIPICLAIVIFILWYGYPFKKFTDQNLKVYQLALTAFAATVGIGTVVNSSRSADTAWKSMELATKKESREQLPHIVASSDLNFFSISPPMYKNDTNYTPAKILAQYLDEFYKPEELVSSESHDKYMRKSFFKASSDIRDKRILYTDIINNLKILNIGKGVAINLEYSFDFMNIDDFKNHQVLSRNLEFSLIGTSHYPSYDISVKKRDSLFLIQITDNIILSYAKQLELDDYNKNSNSIINLTYEYHKNKEYLDYLQPGKEAFLPIPNEFMVLCKHYAMMVYYKNLYSKQKLSNLMIPNLKHLIEKNAIKPVGRAKIYYYNEEEIREKYNGERKKEELIFDIHLKDESIFKQGDSLHFYLEVIPLKIESEVSKKRAYR